MGCAITAKIVQQTCNATTLMPFPNESSCGARFPPQSDLWKLHCFSQISPRTYQIQCTRKHLGPELLGLGILACRTCTMVVLRIAIGNTTVSSRQARQAETYRKLSDTIDSANPKGLAVWIIVAVNDRTNPSFRRIAEQLPIRIEQIKKLRVFCHGYPEEPH